MLSNESLNQFWAAIQRGKSRNWNDRKPTEDAPEDGLATALLEAAPTEEEDPQNEIPSES